MCGRLCFVSPAHGQGKRERGMAMYQGVNASEGIGIGTVMVATDPDLTFEPHEVADAAGA